MSFPDTIPEEGTDELKVTFYPPLFLQRRIWILDLLRAEKITKVLDVGCGEGQLLAVLCQPAPWLAPPPRHLLPPLPQSSDPTPLSPTYNDEIPNLHTTHLFGLDISSADLEFAVQGTALSQDEPDEYKSYLTNIPLRWEELTVKIWKGGLEVINEGFIDVECIVSTEVIEHLPSDIFDAFAPTLLGVYHPRLLLVTTPSYTFNARFTAPSAPPSARRGYQDPTGRSDRIFRHSDHKFEWTADEFREWCQKVAHQWGYKVHISSVGRATEVDEWGRDEELGGATSVAVFRRIEMERREDKARELLNGLHLKGEPHELLATHMHSAHPDAEKAKPLDEIGLAVKKKMEEFREAFMRVEEIWFEQEIAVLCGGWIEMLVRAVEESEYLVLKRDGEDMKQDRGAWAIELVGGVANPKELWPQEGETSLDHIPLDWMPEGEDVDSSDGGWDGFSWKSSDTGWGHAPDTKEAHDPWGVQHSFASDWDSRPPQSSASSITGWDGDESDDTT